MRRKSIPMQTDAPAEAPYANVPTFNGTGTSRRQTVDFARTDHPTTRSPL
jgi:hypothetical protein